MNLRIKKLHPEAIVPTRSSEQASGLDVHALESSSVPPGGRLLVRTGLSAEVPVGYEIQVRSRSGLALKKGIFVLNSPGTVDADYRGEIGVILANFGTELFAFSAGDRIAQFVVAPVTMCGIEVASELSDSSRGAGGFGHTGV